MQLPFRILRRTIVILALALLTAACGGGSDTADGAPVTITLLTHDSFATTDGIFTAFETANNAKVVIARGADAGVVLNQAILTKGKPDGDVLWGVDNTLLSRAIQEKVFASYKSRELPNLDPSLSGFIPTGNEATPIDRGDVCVNAHPSALVQRSLAVPTTLDELADPRYKDMLVVENPATSSPGLAFVLATRAHFGEAWLDYWKKLKANGVKITDGWTAAYTVEFSGSVGKGSRPLVVSYGTSPAAEVGDDGKSATVALAATCFAQVEYAGILAGTKHTDLAGKLIDFLLATAFQEDMPGNMYVFPARAGAAVPPAFDAHGIRPAKPLTLAPGDISANRESWIAQWSDLMLS